ncbi:phage head-tail adapter protein [Eggerthella guodeyinii]|uniref:Phage head-tail adapter protein n=1 Tax=Eggerthella guodeyinii TaxID=2690837 RepID=A0A6N7RLQ4_9ACTN|nr:phage head-tail adapter protein [Eggerthella guodeyinii]MRX82253.1 phage head-tail adapter protein [Eggerthella guodeyinii]
MSGWAGSCQLIAQRAERADYGVSRSVETRRKVPCNVIGMGNAAYYAAAAAGVHPEAVLQVRKAEYGGERLVEFEGVVYSVDRVKASSPDFATLTLVEKVGHRV